MVKGLVIPADPERPIAVQDFTTLKDYEAVVHGWIEAVDVPPLGVTMFVNEEGLVRRQPFNSRATYLWWYELPHLRNQAILVGDVILVGIANDEGEATDIPVSTRTLLTKKELHVVMTLQGGLEKWMSHPFPYDDFIEAVIWAMVLSGPVTDTRDVRVLTLEQFNDAGPNVPRQGGTHREN